MSSSTKVKVTIAEERLQVKIDARGDDDWLDCVSVDMTREAFRLPKDWLVRAHVGITASTGQLADNHDVISLNSFSDAAVLEAHVSSSEELLFSVSVRSSLPLPIGKIFPGKKRL